MTRNGQSSQDREANPAHIVPIHDFSTEVLRNLVAHLDASTDFEHLVYREAELDALWTLTGFCLMAEMDLANRSALNRLHVAVREAHDLVADERPGAAAAILREFF